MKKIRYIETFALPGCSEHETLLWAKTKKVRNQLKSIMCSELTSKILPVNETLKLPLKLVYISQGKQIILLYFIRLYIARFTGWQKLNICAMIGIRNFAVFLFFLHIL